MNINNNDQPGPRHMIPRQTEPTNTTGSPDNPQEVHQEDSSMPGAKISPIQILQTLYVHFRAALQAQMLPVHQELLPRPPNPNQLPDIQKREEGREGSHQITITSWRPRTFNHNLAYLPLSSCVEKAHYYIFMTVVSVQHAENRCRAHL